jgi:hypothetical protein
MRRLGVHSAPVGYSDLKSPLENIASVQKTNHPQSHPLRDLVKTAHVKARPQRGVDRNVKVHAVTRRREHSFVNRVQRVPVKNTLLPGFAVHVEIGIATERRSQSLVSRDLFIDGILEDREGLVGDFYRCRDASRENFLAVRHKPGAGGHAGGERLL